MRLFVAIDVPQDVSIYLGLLQEKLKVPYAKLRMPTIFHITLEYIGETYKEEKILKALEIVKFKKFSLETGEIGVFPSYDFIRVIWLGIKECKDIKDLQREIALTLRRKSGEFIPHITLARASYILDKEKLVTVLKTIKTERMSFQVDTFSLYQSVLLPKGPKYKKIKEFKGS